MPATALGCRVPTLHLETSQPRKRAGAAVKACKALAAVNTVKREQSRVFVHAAREMARVELKRRYGRSVEGLLVHGATHIQVGIQSVRGRAEGGVANCSRVIYGAVTVEKGPEERMFEDTVGEQIGRSKRKPTNNAVFNLYRRKLVIESAEWPHTLCLTSHSYDTQDMRLKMERSVVRVKH